MPTFIERCNCKGIKPVNILGKKHNSRPEVLVHLLQDRHVARFLIAPSGSGKSSLVFEYANIVFGFKKVFWIDCSSPCFLRDLDEGHLYQMLVEVDSEVKLVVCEDVPLLDQVRADAFSTFLDNLLENSIETIVTCTPSCDTFSHLQRDAIILRSEVFLLTDLEMESEEVAGALQGRHAKDIDASQRIACLRWSSDGKHMLLSGLESESVDSETRLAMFLMLVLSEGSTDALMDFISAERVDSITEYISDNYYCLGVDKRLKTFNSIRFELSEIEQYFCKDLESLAAASVCADKDGLCMQIAKALVNNKQFCRACNFMLLYAQRTCLCEWLAKNGMELICFGEASSVMEVYEKTKRVITDYKNKLLAVAMWALFQLDDIAGAVSHAKRLVQSKTASVADRLGAEALLLHMVNNNFNLLTERKLGDLLNSIKYDISALPNISPDEHHAPYGFDCAALAELSLAEHESSIELLLNTAELICRTDGEGKPILTSDSGYRHSALMGIAWTFESFNSRTRDSGGVHEVLFSNDATGEEYIDRQKALEEIVKFIYEYIKSAYASNSISWYGAQASIAYQSVHKEIIQIFDVGNFGKSLAFVDKLALKQLEACDKYRKYKAEQENSRREFNATHPDIFRRNNHYEIDEKSLHTNVPTMNIKLFGGMEAYIGNDLIDPQLIYRKKTKTLIALLVLYRGREAARDQLAETLWPEQSIDSSRRNFYTIITELRKAFSFEGNCPYLIRTQTGYRLDMRLVTSDVYAFEDLCRSLLFGKSDTSDWERLYALVSQNYSGLLMPAELENETVISLRKHFNTQLVDGLVATTSRLIDEGQPRGALWFAREAFQHDEKREDVYISLMEAQIACEQRGEALETYFKCRKFLNEELGIDPSLKLVELYRSIIETEEAF